MSPREHAAAMALQVRQAPSYHLGEQDFLSLYFAGSDRLRSLPEHTYRCHGMLISAQAETEDERAELEARAETTAEHRNATRACGVAVDCFPAGHATKQDIVGLPAIVQTCKVVVGRMPLWTLTRCQPLLTSCPLLSP